jgi:hypothetical protein
MVAVLSSMFNAASHRYMQEDHVVSLNMVVRNDPKSAAIIGELYRQAKELLNGQVEDAGNPKFIRKKVASDSGKTAMVINAADGQYVQLVHKPTESDTLQLSVGKFSLMTVVDPIRSTFQIKVWD